MIELQQHASAVAPQGYHGTISNETMQTPARRVAVTAVFCTLVQRASTSEGLLSGCVHQSLQQRSMLHWPHLCSMPREATAAATCSMLFHQQRRDEDGGGGCCSSDGRGMRSAAFQRMQPV